MNNKILAVATAVGALLCGANAAHADNNRHEPLVVAASNTTTNSLMVFDSNGRLVRQIPTQGQGGVAGNAGGIAAKHGRLAVVNFGSSNVSVFAIEDGGQILRLERVIGTVGSPVSVAWGDDHLYVLTTTHVESHRVGSWGVTPTADGVTQLLLADGSAAQVGVVKGGLVVTEKNNAIETVNLADDGEIKGRATLAANIPANVNAPFGLVTRGPDAYVTIAHANEISLVRSNAVLAVTGSGTQNAPCWLAIDGPFIFSANSPSQSVSRYAVYGQKIVQDAAVVAQFVGNPTDITYRDGFAAVVDADTAKSRVTLFRVDEDGNFTKQAVSTVASPATNGVAIIDAR